MFAVGVHPGAAGSSGVDDAEDDAGGGLAPDPDAALLEVAAGEVAVHPLTASTQAAPTSAAANRRGPLPRSITEQAYFRGLRPYSG
jgi:hypothetical protein